MYSACFVLVPVQPRQTFVYDDTVDAPKLVGVQCTFAKTDLVSVAVLVAVAWTLAAAAGCAAVTGGFF